MVLKVLLVGSGITSSLISAFLKEVECKFRIVVWDKARGIGGRMSTSRSPSNDTCKADLGAQFITALPVQFEKHKSIYDSLMKGNVLQTLTGHIEGIKSFPQGTAHYVLPAGMNSIVKHFLNVDEIQFGFHVKAIKKQDKQICVETNSGYNELFDVVILTQPVPQLFELTDFIQDFLSFDTELKENLMFVKYSSRYALAIFYDENVSFNVPWIAKYIYDDNIFRYVGIEDKKRNIANVPSAVVFHTSIEFGEDNINKPIESVQTQLITHVKSIYPSWPQPSSVKCQKWKYSQVIEPYPGRPGCVTLLETPLLIAAGDGFTASNFDGCISSAMRVVETVTKYVQKNVITV